MRRTFNDGGSAWRRRRVVMIGEATIVLESS
jgi:hypothetical protein